MAEMFSISWSPESLKQIAQLVGMAGMLTPAIQQALSKGADTIIKASQDNMPWGPGPLYDSMQKMSASPWEIDIGSDLPYAHRREFSFKGPDRLGRMFPNDPAAFFLTDALAAHQDDILELLQQGIEATLSQGGS
jgi:hypothetical protein